MSVRRRFAEILTWPACEVEDLILADIERRMPARRTLKDVVRLHVLHDGLPLRLRVLRALISTPTFWLADQIDPMPEDAARTTPGHPGGEA